MLNYFLRLSKRSFIQKEFINQKKSFVKKLYSLQAVKALCPLHHLVMAKNNLTIPMLDKTKKHVFV